MEFIKISGFKGMVFVPMRRPGQIRKHDCRDCFDCQMCGEERCRACRSEKSPKVCAPPELLKIIEQ